MTKRSRFWSRPGFLIFGGAFAVALFVILVIWRSQGLVASTPDPYSFALIGRSIAEGKGFEGFGVVLSRRAPLYPIFIGAIYWLFGEQPFLVQLAQALAFAGTCTLAYDMARRVYNPRAGVIAGVFCMLHPSFLRYVSDFHLETLLTFLFTLAVWRSVVFVERPNWRNGALFGVASGLAALTKAVVLVYPAVFGAVWLFTQRRTLLAAASERGAKLLALAAVFVAMGLTISPWTIRNYFATDGRFVLIGTGASDAFLRGYVFSQWKYATLQEPPYTGAENEVNITFAAMCKEEGVDWNRDDLETDATLGRIAKRRLLSDPIAFVRKSFVGVFTFWYQMTSFKTSLVAGLSALAGWILALIGMPRAARERRRAWLFVAPPLFLNFQLAVLLALGRYSVPILPCLMVLAAFGLDTLIERLQSKKGAATVS